MAEGRLTAQWDHTATLIAVTCEMHRDQKKRRRPFEAAEFHPLRRRQKPRAIPAPITVLRDVFCPGARA